MKESTFAIYKCILQPTEERIANSETTIDVTRAQKILSDTLRSLPKMYKKMKDGREVPYTNSLLRNDENVFIFVNDIHSFLSDACCRSRLTFFCPFILL